MIGLRYRDKTDNCDLKPESFRFSAYRNLFIMTYGRTRAKMERKPLPSCLVMRVRTLYPDPQNQYTGFKAKRLRKRWFFLCFRTECLQQTCSTICPLSLRHSQVDYSGATATAPGARPLRHGIICMHLGLFGFGGFLGVMYLYKNSNFFWGGEGWKSLHVVTIQTVLLM
jgi:hypothetical protein